MNPLGECPQPFKVFMEKYGKLSLNYGISKYHNDPKFSDRRVWANSVDPDQTAPKAVWSGSTLFAIPSASFGAITL